MTNQEMLADSLGIDPDAARAVPDRIRKMAFFEQLALHGIVPGDQNEALRMLQCSDQLETKRAAFIQSVNPVNQAMDLLSPKQAAAPIAPAQRQPGLVHDVRQSPELSYTVNQKIASMLADPLVYGSLMTAFTE
jgi:hypothetical protein